MTESDDSISLNELAEVEPRELDVEDLRRVFNSIATLHLNYLSIFPKNEEIDSTTYCIQVEEPSMPKEDVRALIHNYLAALYSFREVINDISGIRIDTEKEGVPSKEVVKEIKYLIGLRNIIQHGSPHILNLDYNPNKKGYIVTVYSNDFKEEYDSNGGEDPGDFFMLSQKAN